MTETTYTDSRGALMEPMSWGEALDIAHDLARATRSTRGTSFGYS
jgi:hypothetical protein